MGDIGLLTFSPDLAGFVDAARPHSVWMDGQIHANVVQRERLLDAGLQQVIVDGWRAGRTPRFIWRRPDSLTMEGGDSMPDGGPWIVYEVNPEAVAMALGMRDG